MKRFMTAAIMWLAATTLALHQNTDLRMDRSNENQDIRLFARYVGADYRSSRLVRRGGNPKDGRKTSIRTRTREGTGAGQSGAPEQPRPGPSSATQGQPVSQPVSASAVQSQQFRAQRIPSGSADREAAAGSGRPIPLAATGPTWQPKTDMEELRTRKASAAARHIHPPYMQPSKKPTPDSRSSPSKAPTLENVREGSPKNAPFTRLGQLPSHEASSPGMGSGLPTLPTAKGASPPARESANPPGIEDAKNVIPTGLVSRRIRRIERTRKAKIDPFKKSTKLSSTHLPGLTLQSSPARVMTGEDIIMSDAPPTNSGQKPSMPPSHDTGSVPSTPSPARDTVPPIPAFPNSPTRNNSPPPAFRPPSPQPRGQTRSPSPPPTNQRDFSPEPKDSQRSPTPHPDPSSSFARHPHRPPSAESSPSLRSYGLNPGLDRASSQEIDPSSTVEALDLAIPFAPIAPASNAQKPKPPRRSPRVPGGISSSSSGGGGGGNNSGYDSPPSSSSDSESDSSSHRQRQRVKKGSSSSAFAADRRWQVDPEGGARSEDDSAGSRMRRGRPPSRPIKTYMGKKSDADTSE